MIASLLAMINGWRVARLAGQRWDRTHRFYGMPIVKRAVGAKLCLGARLVALSKARFNEIGVMQPVVISLLSPTAKIQIGCDVGMSGCSISARSKISIGAHTMIGSGVLIMDHDAHALPLPGDGQPVSTKDVWVGEHVFIGARAIILKGVRIGDHAVVGAGAVVTKDVSARAVVAGNPARVIRSNS